MSIAKLARNTLAKMLSHPEEYSEAAQPKRCAKCGTKPDPCCNQDGVVTLAEAGFLVKHIICPGLKKAEQRKMGS